MTKIEEILEALALKLDSLSETVDSMVKSSLKNDSEETEKNPLQLKLDTDAELFRKHLRGRFDDKLLEKWGHDELVIAMHLKQDVGNEIPEKSDKDDVEEDWMTAEVH